MVHTHQVEDSPSLKLQGRTFRTMKRDTELGRREAILHSLLSLRECLHILLPEVSPRPCTPGTAIVSALKMRRLSAGEVHTRQSKF